MASNSVARVANGLQTHGVETDIQEMPGSTRTAQDAADAVGASVHQIVKSLVFVNPESEPILVLTGGDTRVDEHALERAYGAPLHFATPEIVRATTGFAIGGVAPVGLLTPMPILMDDALLLQERVWAAAGSPRSVFSIGPKELARITEASIVQLRARKS